MRRVESAAAAAIVKINDHAHTYRDASDTTMSLKTSNDDDDVELVPPVSSLSIYRHIARYL